MLERFDANLWPQIQLQDAIRNIDDIVLGHFEDAKPRWIVGQWKFQFTCRQINASARNRFGCVADKAIGAQRVVHVVPGVLHELHIFLVAQHLQVHDD